MKDVVDITKLLSISAYENESRGGWGAYTSKAARARKAERDQKWRDALRLRTSWSEAEIAAEEARLAAEIARFLEERTTAA